MQNENISAGNLEQCLKCNLCTLVCPMMAVNEHYPGPKKAGPDGERYRIKDPEYYDYALKYCLNCKRCEVSCPSGVKIGDIIQSARLKYAGHNLRDLALASTDLVGSMASPLAPLVNATLRARPVKALMHGVMGVDVHRTFPSYSSQKFTNWFRKASAPGGATPQDGFGKYVSFYHGCYANYNYPQLGKDLVKVVNALGYGVRLLDKERCCGVALISNSFGRQAIRQAKANIASMEKAIAAGDDIVTVSSTCTFTMRDEYPHVLGIDNSAVRPHIMLLSKWLCAQMPGQAGHDGRRAGHAGCAPSVIAGCDRQSSLRFRKDFHLRVAYHSSCHMQKLGWRNYSLELLQMIPGVELVELEPHCCGIAGTFGFKKENYAWSQAIGKTLFDDILAVKDGTHACASSSVIAGCAPSVIAGCARQSPLRFLNGGFAVATECETCKWQIEMSTGVPVLNPVSILAAALEP